MKNYVVGVLADRGKPSLDVMGILSDVTQESQFTRNENNYLVGKGRRRGTTIEAKLGEIPMDYEGQLKLAQAAPTMMERNGWDRLIYVTDLPLVAYNRPVVTQRSMDSDAWVVSSPSFGWVGAKRRLREELTSLIDGHGAVAGTREPSTLEDGQDDDDTVDSRVLDTRWRALQLIAGTTRSNRPLRLPKVLTSSLAAMAASGGFGVFYGSIWNVAHAMSFPRALGVGLLSIVSFTSWMVLRNRLFVRADKNRSPWRRNVDNIATFSTIFLAAAILYVTVFIVMTVLTAAIVPWDYLDSTVDAPTGWFSYLIIGWLSASLGTFAGAIGSNFDERADIVGATFGARDFERRSKWGQFDGENEKRDSSNPEE